MSLGFSNRFKFFLKGLPNGNQGGNMKQFKKGRWLILGLFLFGTLVDQSHAVGPQSTTILSNSVTVDYNDSSTGLPQAQVAANTTVTTLATYNFSVQPDTALVVLNPGETIVVSAILSDSSNTVDSFTIIYFWASTGNAVGNTILVTLYEDANANDTIDVLSDTVINSGDSSGNIGFDTTVAITDTYFAVIDVMSTAPNGFWDTLTIVYTSNNDPGLVDTVTISVLVTAVSNITVTKQSFTDTTFATGKVSGMVGETVVYLITLLNTGAIASQVNIVDTLPSELNFELNMIEVDTGGGWIPMTDAVDADSAYISFGTPDVINMGISSIAINDTVGWRYIVRIGP